MVPRTTRSSWCVPLIENGGEGGKAAAPAAERVFARFFHVPAVQPGIIGLRLMLEYAGSQRAGLRAEREAPRLLAVVRSIDWILLAGVAALVVVGLWGVAGVTKFALPNDPTYYLNRQILYACVGAVVLVVAAIVDPDIYRRYWRGIFIGTAVVIAFVLLVGHAAHGCDTLDQPRLLHLPAVGVREAPVRARDRGDAGRAAAHAQYLGDDPASRRARRSSRSCSYSPT